MITKEEAKNKLRKAGYSVVEDNSVITILIPEKASIKNTVKSVKELLLKIDYQASFGVKQHSSGGEDSLEETGAKSAEEILDEYVEEDAEAKTVESDTFDEAEIMEESEEKAKELDEVPGKPKKKTAKTPKKETKKSKKDTAADEEDDFLDEEDENLEELDKIKLDEFDMDMMLNEESVQFSLEDFGLI